MLNDVYWFFQIELLSISCQFILLTGRAVFLLLSWRKKPLKSHRGLFIAKIVVLWVQNLPENVAVLILSILLDAKYNHSSPKKIMTRFSWTLCSFPLGLSGLFGLGTFKHLVSFGHSVFCIDSGSSKLLPEYQIFGDMQSSCSLDFGCLYVRSRKGWELVHAWARILIYQSSYNPLFSSVFILSLSFDVAEDGKGNTSFPSASCGNHL